MARPVVIAFVLTALAMGCATAGSVPERAPVAAPDSLAIASIGPVSQTMQLTGEASPNRTDRYLVHGTDLGSMFEHDGRIYIVFGDTFGPRAAGTTGAGGALWRSNVMAYTTDRDPTDGITIDGMIVDSTGTAKQLLWSPHGGSEVTKIPTHGVSANGSIYLYYMSVSRWGDPGHWEANYSGVARSVDDGQNFEFVDGMRWPGSSNFIQTAIAPVDGYLYIWTIPPGRFGGVALMRVRPEEIERMDAYEYYAGQRGGSSVWDPRMERARIIVDPPVGELSVMWNQYLERWIMTYLNERTASIEFRESVQPWGPWSEPFSVARGSRYPALYGAYLHPAYVEDEGRVIYFAMSQWHPYNVFLMRAELLRR